jgi:protein-tyrosine kinase
VSLVEKAMSKLRAAAVESRAASPAAAMTSRPQPSRAASVRSSDDRLSRAARANRKLVIDFDALRSKGLYPPVDEERRLAHEYRRIKRPLLANAMGRGPVMLERAQVIQVTSSHPGEGKTFTTMNLAFSMALEKDLHVLMVDGDVAKPNISNVLGAPGEPGLIDALVDAGRDVEDLVLPTSIENLQFLPAGSRSEEATELLASRRADEVLQALTANHPHRIVLLDSPPLLLTTESHELSDFAGQVVVVVRAGVTPQQDVLDALSYLQDHPGVALVLNQSTATSGSGYYGYGYGYGNGVPPRGKPTDEASERP